jgi:signal transduction histidine kinase
MMTLGRSEVVAGSTLWAFVQHSAKHRRALPAGMALGKKIRTRGFEMERNMSTGHEVQSGRILPQWASINRVVLDVFRTYEPAFTAKRLASGLDLDPITPLTWADRAQLRHGLGNILGHAVKHSSRGGMVFCRTALEGDWVRLILGDNGPGMSADEALHLFKSHAGANHLGEAQEIIAAHGGQIGFDPTVAKGAWFVVRLPGIAMENARLNEELEQTRRGSLDLVAGLSYDLRTPMHAIIGYSDLLRDGTFGDLNSAQADTVKRIEQGARELLGLVDGAIEMRYHEDNPGELEEARAQLPERLKGFCQLGLEVLECDVSYAFVWQPATDAFIPIASCGSPTAEESWAKGLRVSNMQLLRLLSTDPSGTASVLHVHPRELFSADSVSECGLDRCVVIPVRRNNESIGLLVAGYRGRPRPFTAEHAQFAEGIGDLAGLAVENALLSEQLNQTDRVMTEFVASMSHRSRIPLNVIIGYSDLLFEGEFGMLSTEQAGIADRLRSSGRELLAAINKNLQPGQPALPEYDA